MNATLLVLLVVLFLFVVVPIAIYNGLIARRNGVDNALASLDANLQKRFDLIPNLVATVKGYAKHERETLEAVTAMRQNVQGASPAQRAEADAQMGPLVGRLLAVAEGYPELKASEGFLGLQRSLNEAEEQISASRRTVNASVNGYNTAIQSFPGNLFAGAFGFMRRDFYAAEPAAQKAPDLSNAF